MRTVYEAAGGSAGLRRPAEAWHSRVLADDVAGHPFRHGVHREHTDRLAAYWAEALGGPTTYSDRHGSQSAVLRTHSGNGEHADVDRRAIACFDRALEDTGLAADEPLRRVLHDYFAWATTTAMNRCPDSPDDVPDGLPVPHWTWTGTRP